MTFQRSEGKTVDLQTLTGGMCKSTQFLCEKKPVSNSPYDYGFRNLTGWKTRFILKLEWENHMRSFPQWNYAFQSLFDGPTFFPLKLECEKYHVVPRSDMSGGPSSRPSKAWIPTYFNMFQPSCTQTWSPLNPELQPSRCQTGTPGG